MHGNMSCCIINLFTNNSRIIAPPFRKITRYIAPLIKVKKIAVVGAGIIGVCNAFFLQKSGYEVTLFDKEEPGSMTSFGHACTFADNANTPVNSPSLFKELPSLLIRKDGPLAIDLWYVMKNLPWAYEFLKNCNSLHS